MTTNPQRTQYLTDNTPKMSTLRKSTRVQHGTMIRWYNTIQYDMIWYYMIITLAACFDQTHHYFSSSHLIMEVRKLVLCPALKLKQDVFSSHTVSWSFFAAYISNVSVSSSLFISLVPCGPQCCSFLDTPAASCVTGLPDICILGQLHLSRSTGRMSCEYKTGWLTD